MQDDLVFPLGQPQGFSTLATTQWDGKPEPIVRELLQNCLDAAAEIDCERAKVDFVVRRVPLEQVPGIQSYRKHFEEAVSQRRAGSQGKAEKLVIRRIQQILEAETIPVLVCRDNGVGLDPERMERLLTEGNTDKGKGGAGAFGLGHLTAFAGSDLRYVLYGGRWGDDGGEVHEVASGHAILASRALGNGEGGRGGDGYWLHGEEATLFHQSPYPDRAPPLLRKELDQLGDTGSVVCLAGFNGFRSEADPVQAIAQVAARNFLVAIWEGKMVVRVRAEGGREVDVTPDTLGKILEQEKNKKRGAQTGRWLPGAQAYQAWRTLKDGVPLELQAGAPASILPLEAGRGSKPESRVQVFRNGMWITNSADELEPRHFRTCKPFAAVVMVTDGKLAELVRDAEGPEHRHLERSRLERQDSRDLLVRLRRIAAELRERAGEEEVADEFTPEGFVPLAGDVERKAEKVPSYRPREGTSENEATVADRNDKEDDGVDARRRRGTKKTRKSGAAPKQGRTVPGQLAYRASRNGAGTIDAVKVVWDPRDGALSATDLLGVRVRVPSGSDQTCELPLGPKWIPIREVRFEDGAAQPPKDNPFEAALPNTARHFEVMLGEGLGDPNAVEVDIVRRRNDSTARSAASPVE